jgi:hypothetical protein
MTLTPDERKTLRLALRLATAWESSLIDANSGPAHAQTVRQCRRNLGKFARLLMRLEAAEAKKEQL